MNMDNIQSTSGSLKKIKSFCEEIRQINQKEIGEFGVGMKAYWDGGTAELFYDKISGLQSRIEEELNGIEEAVDNVSQKYKIENSRQNAFWT